MATHPINDSCVIVKEEIVIRVRNFLLGRGSVGGGLSRRTIALCCASYAANVLENALLYEISDRTKQVLSDGSEGSTAYTSSLSYSQKDMCFARCEELLTEYSNNNNGRNSKRNS